MIPYERNNRQDEADPKLYPVNTERIRMRCQVDDSHGHEDRLWDGGALSMKFRSFSFGIAAAAVVVSCMVPMRVVAQTAGGSPAEDGIHAPLPKSAAEDAIKAAEAKPTPRTADGHPDLNGFWEALSIRSPPARAAMRTPTETVYDCRSWSTSDTGKVAAPSDGCKSTSVQA